MCKLKTRQFRFCYYHRYSLFVKSYELGPWFWSLLKENAKKNGLCPISSLDTGVVVNDSLLLLFYYYSKYPIFRTEILFMCKGFLQDETYWWSLRDQTVAPRRAHSRTVRKTFFTICTTPTDEEQSPLVLQELRVRHLTYGPSRL